MPVVGFGAGFSYPPAMLKAILARTLCAALLLAAAPALAPAQSDGESNDGKGGDGVELPQWAHVRIQLENGDRFTPDGIVISLNGAGGYYLDLGQPAETRDENKVDLGGIPLLGKLGIGQESTSSEFRGAERVGEVFRYQDNILMKPLPGTDGARLATRVRTTIIANQGQSFLIDMSAEELDNQIPGLGDVPLLGEMFRIGDAYSKRRTLLILVTPHLIDLDE
jgi:hypothetical protein